MTNKTKIHVSNEQLDAIVALCKSISRQSTLIENIVSADKICPMCKKIKTDLVEIEFMDKAGMCLTCDSVSNDICECGNPTSYESDFCEDCL